MLVHNGSKQQLCMISCLHSDPGQTTRPQSAFNTCLAVPGILALALFSQSIAVLRLYVFLARLIYLEELLVLLEPSTAYEVNYSCYGPPFPLAHK